MESSISHLPRYHHIQILIHWLSALLIIFIIVLPLSRNFWAPLFGGISQVFMLHKSLSVIVFMMTIVRIVVNIKLGVPEVLPANAHLLRLAANSTQKLLYLLLLMLPISGFLMGAKGINFFNIWLIPAMDLSSETMAIAHTSHIWGAYIMIALILLHAVAALFHHYIKKDNVLNSMRMRREG
ncbi:cytochrome b [Utexia brackfieldae]|uniref:cytochrome b n=1 Tax=Utexia brackfieldae TaxID=3074108 RepID=UPI00370DAF55